MVEQRVTDRQFIVAVPVDVEGIGVVAGSDFVMPLNFELIIQDPEIPVAILYDKVSRPAVAGEVTEEQAVAQNLREFVSGWMAFGGGRHVLDLAGCSVYDEDLKILAVDHLVLSIAVDIVDLHAHIVCEVMFFRIRLTDAPQDVSIEVHRR